MGDNFVSEGVTRGIRLLAGRYQIGELIGRGGMADVHEGTDARLGRRVAIKLLKPELASDPTFRTRFRREAQDAAKMAHPTIVRIFDAGEETVASEDGHETQVPFIIMEFVDGKLLKDMLKDGPLPPKEAVRIIGQVLTALEYSHRAGVIHRDIKPGNIMVTASGQVKVMDFGIARAVSDSTATLAETSAIVGTAQYFSPEQARGEAVDARTDLYSTGVVLFELLTGQAPFRGENPVAVAYQHVNQNPSAPSKLNRAVSPALDAVVLRALSKDRTTRFQSPAEFRENVEAAERGEIPVVKPKAPVVRDAAASLFGVNPETTAGADATIRQLSVDEDSRVARTQSRPPVAWIWAGILVMGVVIVAVLFWATNLPRTPVVASMSISVPDVVGQSYEDGAAQLEAANLVPQQLSEANNGVEAGQIIRTIPEVGTSVGPQQLVKVYVSIGKTPVKVPRVTGLTLNKAKEALAKRNLVVGPIEEANSPNIKKDVVISTTPDGGFEASEGDQISIVVSTGRVKVPNVVGDKASEAGDSLSKLQLKVTVTPNEGCSGGRVTSQSLSPGTHKQKSEITIGVCTG